MAESNATASSAGGQSNTYELEQRRPLMSDMDDNSSAPPATSETHTENPNVQGTSQGGSQRATTNGPSSSVNTQQYSNADAGANTEYSQEDIDRMCEAGCGPAQYIAVVGGVAYCCEGQWCILRLLLRGEVPWWSVEDVRILRRAVYRSCA
ncbi:hypothetical protein IAT40_007799 [Kwoniella sp. CBS 6097]